MKKNPIGAPLVQIIAVAALAAMLMTGAGCKSDAQWERTTAAYMAFIQQQRTFNSFEAVGSNMTFTVSGASRIAMSAPLNPLSAIPEDPGIVRELVDGTVRLGAIAAAAYGFHEAFDGQGDVINNAAPAQ